MSRDGAAARRVALLSGLIEWTLGVLCAAILFGLMLITFVDVVLRYGFSSPLGGAFDLTEVLLVLLVFSGLPIVSLRGMHIATDLIDRFLPPRAARVLDAAIQVLWIVCLGGVCRMVWVKAARLAEDRAVTAVMELPLGALAYAIAALLLVTALAHAVRFAERPAPDAPAGSSAL